MRVLHAPPSEHGYIRTSWRMRDIKTVLDSQGKVATLNNIRAVIRAAGVQWKQAHVALTRKDPDYRAKLDAIRATLANLGADEAFFSVDELGPVAVKMRGGRSLQLPGKYRKLHLSWHSAPWHRPARLKEHLMLLNDRAVQDRRPRIEILPLPTSAQFLNVIESVFSGMARAVLHNSDYATLEHARAALTRHFKERNDAFRREPRRAGRTIWGMERTLASFSEANNCKDSRWMGLR